MFYVWLRGSHLGLDFGGQLLQQRMLADLQAARLKTATIVTQCGVNRYAMRRQLLRTAA
jgi:hypothetical protein